MRASHVGQKRFAALVVQKHEACVCGHCRCHHHQGFAECLQCRECKRYTWVSPAERPS